MREIMKNLDQQKKEARQFAQKAQNNAFLFFSRNKLEDFITIYFSYFSDSK
jgi:hypothetical protein